MISWNGTLVFATILVGIPAHSQDVPIESDAIISDTTDFSRSKLLSLVDPGVAMIRINGWKCDSLSAIRPYLFSRGFTIVCNNFSYTYNFSDEGGNWVVELD